MGNKVDNTYRGRHPEDSPVTYTCVVHREDISLHTESRRFSRVDELSLRQAALNPDPSAFLSALITACGSNWVTGIPPVAVGELRDQYRGD